MSAGRHAPIALAALILLLGSPVAAGEKAGATPWQTLRPGGQTGCAFGEPFEFWVREGDPSRVLIYLQGGGACWSLESCDPRRGIAFDPAIDSIDLRQRRDGIFDQAGRSNPFRSYTAVFVPYCTGDFHLGNRRVRYPAPAGDSLPSITVSHVGSRNVTAVVDWLARRGVRPGRVVVSGGSAGAIASPLVAGDIARRIPGAEVIQLGDGVAGIHGVTQARTLLAVWGADSLLRTSGVPIDSAGDVFTSIYKAMGRKYPRIHFSQTATSSDMVVAGWLQRFGYDPRSIPANIQETYRELSAAGLCFNGYEVPGSDHTILWRPGFLTVRSGTGLLADHWRTEVLEGGCGGSAAFLFAYRPRPELADSFASGYKRHLAWHAEHRDSLAWLAWSVVDGAGLGTFIDGAFGISFAAFDARVEPASDGADMRKNVLGFADPVDRQVFRLRAELSSARRLEEARPGTMQRVLNLTVRPGELPAFFHALGLLRDAATTDYAVYERLSGGSLPGFLMIIQIDGWGDLGDVSRDPSATLLRDLSAISSVESSIWQYQPGLTYFPPR